MQKTVATYPRLLNLVANKGYDIAILAIVAYANL